VGASPHRTDGPWSIRYMSYIRALAVGTSPLYGWALVHPLYVIHPSFGGGSKPPPYEGTLITQVSTPRAVFDR